MRGLSDPLGNLAPDVVPSLSEEVTFLRTPNVLVYLRLGVECCVYHLDVQVGQIVHMNIVHGRLPSPDDGGSSSLERHVRHDVNLSALGVSYSSALAIDGRRADNCRLDSRVLSSSQHNLVDIAVEGVVGEAGERIDPLEIIVRLVCQRLTVPVGVSVLVSQDACAASVNPVSGLLLAVPCCQACGKGLGCSFMV